MPSEYEPAAELAIWQRGSYYRLVRLFDASGNLLMERTLPRDLLDAITSVSGGQPLADGTYTLPLRPATRKEP